MRLSQQREKFEIESEWAIDTDDLRRVLLNYQPQIVHFSGHGAGDEGLVLQDKNGDSKLSLFWDSRLKPYSF